MKENYDIIIVGARCSGATLAIELGKEKYEVLLLDQSNFPSDTNSTHAFFNNTVYMLRELGVMPLLEKTTAPPIRRVLFQFNDIAVEGDMPIVHNEEYSYCIPRTYFDQVMYDCANSFESVTSLEGFRVSRLLRSNRRVIGVEGVTQTGESKRFTAKLVVGADGRRSTIRSLLGLLPKRKISTDYSFFYSYLTGLEQSDPPKFEIHQIKGSTLAIFPTSDQRYVTFIACPNTSTNWLRAFRQNPRQAYVQYLKMQFPIIDFEKRLKNARIVDKVKGLFSFDNYWFPMMGKGWALVGDAAIFKDPGVAQGMHDAIFAARTLAAVLKEHDWEKEENKMILAYEERVQEKILGLFELALNMTKYKPGTPEQRKVQQIISQYPNVKEKFFGIYNYANGLEELNEEIVGILGLSNVN
jgi:2-polyprenyl-6-methoxyphenol hydroxylase-like FAD-dependent oxidoreductase